MSVRETLILSVALLACASAACQSAGKKKSINADWTTTPKPGDAGALNPPEDDNGTLRIGTDLATQGRKNGHPDSKGVATFDCGSGSSCEISYSWGTRTGVSDGEKLEISISNARDAEEFTLTSYPDGSSDPFTGTVTLTGCGKITVEVTVDAGGNPADVATAFELVLRKKECSGERAGAQGENVTASALDELTLPAHGPSESK